MSVIKFVNVALTAILVCAMLTGSQIPSIQEGQSECPILVEHAKEIEKYKPIARKIIDFFLSGDMRGRTYKNLNNFVDNYGPRMLGSSGLRRAITHVYRGLKRHNFSNVRMEPVNIPVWVRPLMATSDTLVEGHDLSHGPQPTWRMWVWCIFVCALF
uniref:Uncharacterized protein n=1 Tax=Timema bartmani TaxID=61472 RepID=A0A7R9F2L4_9NEOP|nr:unnamed protein product [Timema bartmani]